MNVQGGYLRTAMITCMLIFVGSLGVVSIIGSSGGEVSTGGGTSGGSSSGGNSSGVDWCCNTKGGGWCVHGGVCCPSATPHYCASTDGCYKYFTQAQDACGNSYEVCGCPVGRTSEGEQELERILNYEIGSTTAPFTPEDLVLDEMQENISYD